jgi:hypothetical protein
MCLLCIIAIYEDLFVLLNEILSLNNNNNNNDIYERNVSLTFVNLVF